MGMSGATLSRGTRGAVVAFVLAALLACTCASAPAAVPQSAPRATVLEVQHLLGELGYPLGKLPLGGLGVRTKGAISYFQRKYALPVTGYPDPMTIVAMRSVAASLRAAPATDQAPPHDLVERTLGEGAPILTIAIVLAGVLALLALSTRRRSAQDSPIAEDTVPAASGDR
jgi:peptidoglycan hydrolase-like protein with peptidoglycan-binding domain